MKVVCIFFFFLSFFYYYLLYKLDITFLFQTLKINILDCHFCENFIFFTQGLRIYVYTRPILDLKY